MLLLNIIETVLYVIVIISLFLTSGISYYLIYQSYCTIRYQKVFEYKQKAFSGILFDDLWEQNGTTPNFLKTNLEKKKLGCVNQTEESVSNQIPIMG